MCAAMDKKMYQIQLSLEALARRLAKSEAEKEYWKDKAIQNKAEYILSKAGAVNDYSFSR